MQISLFLLVFAGLLIGAMLSGQRKPLSPIASRGWQRETASPHTESIGRERAGMKPGLSTVKLGQDGDLSQRHESQLRIAALDVDSQKLQAMLAQQQQQTSQMEATLQQSQRELAAALDEQRQTAQADDKSDQLPNDKPSPLTAPFDEAQAKAAQEEWAESLGKSSPVEENSIGMELVLIPPGEFIMGSPMSEHDELRKGTLVDVTLTQSFYLGKTEVTQGQWQFVMGTSPWENSHSHLFREGDNYPATYVSWDDAQAFCKKLSEKEKVVYRLPTEAEWEYACRGGETTRYSFGDDESKLSDYAWWGGNSGEGNAKYERYAHEVGLKKPNPFGLYDIHGNAWEWSEDVDAWLDTFPGGTDPLVSEGGSNRVSRGGGWFWDAATCRSASRCCIPPDSQSICLGFRVAISSGQ